MDGYTQLGYDQFLQKADPWQQTTQSNQPQQLGSIDFENFTPDLSGSKVQGGVIVSTNNKMKVDLEKNTITINDGVQDRVVMGTLPDGSIGFLIVDQNEHTLQQISEQTNILKSADDIIELDLNNNRLLFKDAGGTPIALFGQTT